MPLTKVKSKVLNPKCYKHSKESCTSHVSSSLCNAKIWNGEWDSFRCTIIQQYDEIPKFRTSTDLSTNNRIAKLQLVEGYAVGARNFFIRLYNGTTEGSMFCFNFQWKLQSDVLVYFHFDCQVHYIISYIGIYITYVGLQNRLSFRLEIWRI